MTREQKREIARDQIGKFFSSYYGNWRLHQILTIEKLLLNKYDFFRDLITETRQLDDENNEATIAQEITNGYMFQALSEAIQSIEDLFALMNAAKDPDYFVKNIITYSTGKIYNLITKNYTKQELCEFFYFPYFNDSFEDYDTEVKYRECIDRLFNYIQDLKTFFSENEFFYTQYKHGLTVALRPFGKYNDEQVEKDKEAPTDAYLVAFDNLSITKIKKGSTRHNGVIFMPHLTPSMNGHVNTLLNEDNLIRFVRPKSTIDIQVIKQIAFKTRDCVSTIGNNLMAVLNDNESTLNLQLPAETFGLAYTFPFETVHIDSAVNKNHFRK